MRRLTASLAATLLLLLAVHVASTATDTAAGDAPSTGAPGYARTSIVVHPTSAMPQMRRTVWHPPARVRSATGSKFTAPPAPAAREVSVAEIVPGASLRPAAAARASSYRARAP